MNKKNLIIAGAVGAALSLAIAGGAALAHHAFAAEFDGKAPVLLRGKVTRVEWINPHAWVHLDNVAPNLQHRNVDPHLKSDVQVNRTRDTCGAALRVKHISQFGNNALRELLIVIL